MAERRKDFSLALEIYSQCLTECGTSISREHGITDDDTRAADDTQEAAICADQPMSFIRELKGGSYASDCNIKKRDWGI